MSLREAARRPFPPRAGKERKLKPYVDFLPSRAYSLFSPPCPRCSLTLRQAGSVSLERGLEENGPAKKSRPWAGIWLRCHSEGAAGLR